VKCCTVFESPEYEIQECENSLLILKPRSNQTQELLVQAQSEDNIKNLILLLLLLCKNGILVKATTDNNFNISNNVNILKLYDEQIELWIGKRPIFKIPLILKASYVLGLVDLIKHALSRLSR